MDEDNRSVDLNKKTKNEIRLSLNLSEEQKEFIHSFSFGGLIAAGLGGIIFVLIYNTITRQINNMETWQWLAIIPIANFYVAYRLWTEGKKLSWEKGRWSSYEEFSDKHGDVDVIIPSIIFILIIFAILAVIVPLA